MTEGPGRARWRAAQTACLVAAWVVLVISLPLFALEGLIRLAPHGSKLLTFGEVVADGVLSGLTCTLALAALALNVVARRPRSYLLCYALPVLGIGVIEIIALVAIVATTGVFREW